MVREIRLLRFALHRLVTLPPQLPNLAVARSSAAHAASLLASRLLTHWRRGSTTAHWSSCRPARLNGLPWAVLDRQVTVAPSASVWLRATSVARRSR